MYSPIWLGGWRGRGEYLRNGTHLGERVMSVAVLTTSRELTNQYEWTQLKNTPAIPKTHAILIPGWWTPSSSAAGDGP